MSSAVRSPSRRLYSRRANATMSWSISSPPMRMLRLTTIPPRLMTATSVVPPPMSTMRLPDGSLTGSPAPIAAAMGSSMSRAQRAPALRAASRTARFSTSVTPEGMPSSIRGRGIRPMRSCTRCTKYLIICSVTSKSLMTPSRSGRTAMMSAGVRPTIRLASAPIGEDTLGLRVDRHDARLADDDAAVAHVDERVRGPEVDPDVPGEHAEDDVEEARGRCSLRGAVDRGRRRRRAVTAPMPKGGSRRRTLREYTRGPPGGGRGDDAGSHRCAVRRGTRAHRRGV